MRLMFLCPQLGDEYSAADLSVFPRLDMLGMMGLPVPKEYFPNTHAYMQRVG